jgi:hypothetical protein
VSEAGTAGGPAAPAPAATAARPSLTLLPLGDSAVAVCDGDTCVIPGAAAPS